MAEHDEYHKRLEWLARVREKVSDGTIGATATAVASLARPVINFVISKASRESALHRLIREIHGRHPNITLAELIERLRREKGSGVIADIDDEAQTVSWAPSPAAALRDAPFKSIGEMLSRIRHDPRAD